MNLIQRFAGTFALLLATASSALATTQDLGTVGTAGTSFSNTVTTNGNFVDYYTFKLAGATNGATGGALDSAWSFFYEGIDITGVSLSAGGVQIGTVDTSPASFTFSGLTSGVTYTLAVSGTVLPNPSWFSWNLNGSYQGAIKATMTSVASPAPEGADFALTAMGLGGVAFWSRRRRAA